MSTFAETSNLVLALRVHRFVGMHCRGNQKGSSVAGRRTQAFGAVTEVLKN